MVKMYDPHKKKKTKIEELRWYEIIFCCCKCRAECKSCVAKTFLYFVPIIVLILIAIGCIVIGVIYRDCCSYKSQLPYWVLGSSVSPFCLLTFIKAVKEEYYGCTTSRLAFILIYFMFLASTILGTIWSIDTWKYAPHTSCHTILQWSAFILSCFHWLLFLLATIPMIYVLTQICCCCSDNAIIPLKTRTDMHYDL